MRGDVWIVVLAGVVMLSTTVAVVIWAVVDVRRHSDAELYDQAGADSDARGVR